MGRKGVGTGFVAELGCDTGRSWTPLRWLSGSWGALARGERFRVAALYGPAEPGSGGESGSHPGEIPAPAGGASQAAASLGFLERRSRAGFHSS